MDSTHSLTPVEGSHLTWVLLNLKSCAQLPYQWGVITLVSLILKLALT